MKIKIPIMGNSNNAKEEFIKALNECGFDINRLARLTEAVFSDGDNYTLVTITEEGEIAIFSKNEHEEETGTEPNIAVFSPPRTSIGYNMALDRTLDAIEPGLLQ